MRKVAVYSYCNFALTGMSCIINNNERRVCSCLKSASPFLGDYLYADIELSDVFIHIAPGVVDHLRLIKNLLTLSSPPRVIVMVNDTHVPTLKLLLTMGVTFILSLRDSLEAIDDALRQPAFSHYMSPELRTVMEITSPEFSCVVDGKPFDGVQYLTSKEMEIILDLFQGMSTWQVARKRFVSIKTVSTHKFNALKKMKLSGFNELFISLRR